MADKISKFDGKHRFLSNFWMEPFVVALPEVGVVEVKSAEHAFQALKARRAQEARRILTKATPGGAKRKGRQVELRPDWMDVRIGAMAHVLAGKFAPGSELARSLVATSPYDLEEGNDWGDIFWGVVPLAGGENWLGRLLMARRSGLQFVGEERRGARW